jgi:hypothetical protein
MLSRRIVGVAIVSSAMSIVLGGQAAHAQTPSSVRFVNLLLMNQSNLILKDMNALNQRDADIVKLNNATTQRQINQLNRLLTKLNNQILVLTTQLTIFSTQTYNYAKEFSPANPTLVSEAFQSLLTVQMLSLHSGLGIAPATPTQ